MNTGVKILLWILGIILVFFIFIIFVGVMVSFSGEKNLTSSKEQSVANTDGIKENSIIDSPIPPKQYIEPLSSKNLQEIIIQGEDLPTEWKYNEINILNESLQHPIQHYDINFNLLDGEKGISRSAIIEYDWDTAAVIGHKLYAFSTKERADEVYANIINTIKEKRGYTEIPTGVKSESFGFFISNENCVKCATILMKKSNVISILFHGRPEGYPGASFNYLGSELVEDTNKNIEKRI